ncbi:MAG: oligosaccharide flippase family protein [Ignavibacteriales bacterium]|nr:oligosaccharide flippase family protein [Ignavibacteriales bacterium]
MLFQFLTVMLVVRYVTKNEMGMYALIMVVVNMFSLLGGLGLELTMVKSIASSKVEENKDILIPILVLRALGAFVFSIVFLLAGKFILHFFDDHLSLYLIYVPIIFVLANFRDLFYNLLQG